MIFQRQGLINLIADEVDKVCMGGVWIGKAVQGSAQSAAVAGLMARSEV